MNKVILCGNLGQEPKLVVTKSDKKIVNFSVATKSYKKESTWHNCVAFEKTADFISSYLGKGSKVLLEGRIEYEKYQDKAGIDKTATKIICERVEGVSPKKEQEKEPYQPTEEELPF